MRLSIIIPCYNHGQYLQDVIDSISCYNDEPIEIIIIDDGSTEELTILKIEELKQKNYHVIQQKNSGLAFSRNVGICIAKGKYILPLDADNKIKPDYIRKALAILESDEYDIVYAKPVFFGDNIESRKFKTQNFNSTDLIFGNFIDACAIYRKDVWIRNNGYDERMPHPGVEDWEFWINSFFNGYRFKFLNEDLYEYRIVKDSMIEDVFKEHRYEESHKYIFNKHFTKIIDKLLEIKHQSNFFKSDQKKPLRSVFKYLKIWLKRYVR